MAILKKNGKKNPKLTGILGPTLYYQLNGDTVGRTIGALPKSYSQAQLTAQQGMAVVSAFLNPMLDIINVGLSQAAKKMKKNPHNVAVSHLMKEALTGVYPDVGIDYSKVLLSKGNLLSPTSPEVILTTAGLEFKWINDLEFSDAHASDQAILVAYYPLVNQVVFSLCGGKRIGLRAVLALPKRKNAGSAETYIAFISANGKRTSNSIYTGLVPL